MEPDAALENDGKLNTSTDVLTAIREQASSSHHRFSGIDDSLASMEKELSKKILAYTGETANFELAEVAIFDIESPTVSLDDHSAITRIDGDEDQLLFCLCMSSTTFRNMLAAILGDSGATAAPETSLTFAERKLFIRFVDQLMAGYFEILDSISDIGIPRKPRLIDDLELQALGSGIELVSITFEFEITGGRQSLTVLAPLAVLEPSKSAKPDTDEDEILEKTQLIWTQSLINNVEQMEIPLNAQAVSMELTLSDISELKVGQNMDLTLDPEGVKFLDTDGNLTFVADMVFQENQVRLRVAAGTHTGD